MGDDNKSNDRHKTLERCARSFNSSIKRLARVYAQKKKGSFEEEKVLRNNKRLDILVASYPNFIIETVGPMFLKYADVIKERDFDKFLDFDFEEEKNIYKSSEDGARHSFKDMNVKIEFLKNMFRDADDDEKKAFADIFEILLSSYCEYALTVKKM